MSHCFARLTRRTAALAVLGALVAPSAAAQTGRDTAEVRVAATATRGVRPNQASITLQFATDGANPREAGERLTARTDSLRRRLAQLGIPKDSIIATSSWYQWIGRLETVPSQRMVSNGRGGLTPAFDTIYNANGWSGRPVFDTTYRARESVEIRLHDLTQVAAIVDAAMALRINQISEPRFRATNTRQEVNDALSEATELARQQAETIATASEGRLGRVISLSTLSEEGNRFGYSTVVTPSPPGEVWTAAEVLSRAQPISVTVFGRWQLLARP